MTKCLDCGQKPVAGTDVIIHIRGCSLDSKSSTSGFDPVVNNCRNCSNQACGNYNATDLVTCGEWRRR